MQATIKKKEKAFSRKLWGGACMKKPLRKPDHFHSPGNFLTIHTLCFHKDGSRKGWADSSRKVWFFWQQHQLTFQTAELAHKNKNIAYIFENSELWRYKHYIKSHELKHTLELYLKHTLRKAHAWKFQLPMKQSWPKPLKTHCTI